MIYMSEAKNHGPAKELLATVSPIEGAIDTLMTALIHRRGTKEEVARLVSQVKDLMRDLKLPERPKSSASERNVIEMVRATNDWYEIFKELQRYCGKYDDFIADGAMVLVSGLMPILDIWSNDKRKAVLGYLFFPTALSTASARHISECRDNLPVLYALAVSAGYGNPVALDLLADSIECMWLRFALNAGIKTGELKLHIGDHEYKRSDFKPSAIEVNLRERADAVYASVKDVEEFGYEKYMKTMHKDGSAETLRLFNDAMAAKKGPILSRAIYVDPRVLCGLSFADAENAYPVFHEIITALEGDHDSPFSRYMKLLDTLSVEISDEDWAAERRKLTPEELADYCGILVGNLSALAGIEL